MITLEQSEQMQTDLITYFDSAIPEELINDLCQTVVTYYNDQECDGEVVMKKVCEECGSDDVIYFCTAKFDPNDDYKYIEMDTTAFDETFEWCNKCKAHTVFEVKNEES